MLTVVSGLPGHGKTLNTLREVHTEYGGKREIYYHGIPDLTLGGWYVLDDPRAWFALPPESVIVIDESQKPFPQRGLKDKPKWIEEFETHRHKGYDIFLLTQDPKLVDHNIRRLAGRHVHYWRPLGFQAATRWEWQRVVDPHDREAKKEAIDRRVVKFDRKFYGVYKSADAHTHKSKLPRKLLAIPAVVVVLISGIVGAAQVLTGVKDKLPGAADSESPAGHAVQEIRKAEHSAVRPGKPEPVLRVSGVVDLGGGVGYAFIEDGVDFKRVALADCVRVMGQWSCQVGGVRVVERRGAGGESEAPAALARETSL